MLLKPQARNLVSAGLISVASSTGQLIPQCPMLGRPGTTRLASTGVAAVILLETVLVKRGTCMVKGKPRVLLLIFLEWTVFYTVFPALRSST